MPELIEKLRPDPINTLFNRRDFDEPLPVRGLFRLELEDKIINEEKSPCKSNITKPSCITHNAMLNNLPILYGDHVIDRWRRRRLALKSPVGMGATLRIMI